MFDGVCDRLPCPRGRRASPYITRVPAAAARMKSAQLSLVIPCYNEAERLDLTAFARFLDDVPQANLLFVDDGSTDGTRAMLEAFAAAQADRVDVLVQPENRGKAEAVRAGMRRASTGGSNLVGFWDADLATPLDAVMDLLGVISRRTDIDWVLGARVQLLGRDIRRRAIRHYLGRVFATAASIVLSMPVYDTQCGAKLFRVSTELDEVLSRPFVSRWVFDVEMLARLAKIRRRDGNRPAVESVFEFPLQQWTDVGGSKVRSGDFLKASIELLRIWRDPLPGVSPARSTAESQESSTRG